MRLSPLLSKYVFAHLLNTSLSKLNFILYARSIESQYHHFTINKKNGTKRTIYAPTGVLKTYQRKTKLLLDAIYDPHNAAHAFIEGRSIVTNAKQHTKQKVVLNLDLKDFYDQIHFGRIYGMLCAEPYSLNADVARLIAHLCCVKNILPQGGVTSPTISNMICRTMDRELSLLARQNKAKYSRYADDITFSFHNYNTAGIFKELVGGKILLSEPLTRLIKKNGFAINESKTRVQTSLQRQVVTGLKVNRKVNLDRRYIRTTRAMVHSLTLGVESANKVFTAKMVDNPNAGRLENVVHGRINFIGMVKGVESSVYQGLASKFNSLDIQLKLRIEPKTRDEKLERILHFNSYKHRERLENSVWVLDFDNVESVEDDIDAALSQGSAFMVKGNVLITAAHNFKLDSELLECNLYRIKEPGVKFKGRVTNICRTSDIAIVEFVDPEVSKFPFLDIAPQDNLNAGYMVSLIGFPQVTPGHNSVSIIPALIINRLAISTFTHYEVDKSIVGGISGGAAVNAYMQVVGMVRLGLDQNNEGRNAIVSSVHFEKPLHQHREQLSVKAIANEVALEQI